MVAFPNCKINLGLHITGKRQDGYHDLETVFFPLNLTDILEVIRKENTIPGEDASSTPPFSTSGIIVTAKPGDNICLKAYQVLKNEFPDKISSSAIHLHKTIPAGAGLGGGSSDAAFTLKLLNRLFLLDLSPNQLIRYALALGSDCPFFIVNKPCLATGRGEILKAINPDLSSYKIIVVNPGIPISTAWAFSKIIPGVPAKPIEAIIQQPVTSWKAELKNDFESVVFDSNPEIAAIKDLLYDNGAVYAAMSGSGSTVFGIFNQSHNLSFNFPNHYFVHIQAA